MHALTPKERFHLEAAEGWLMLGSPVEAHAELEEISPEANRHPAMLAMRWQVYAAARWWEAAYVVSRALCDVAPRSPEAWICQANTLRNYQGTLEARRLLLGVAPLFPENPVIRYNLACYAAQMNLLEEACGWLVQAFEQDESVQLKLASLYDPDLQPLWEKIGRHRVREVTGHAPQLLAAQD